jgi:hypothetical protein
MQVAPPVQQRLLHRFVGSVRAAEHETAEELEPSYVVIDELPEGALIAESRRREQAALLIGLPGMSVDRHARQTAVAA